MPSSLLHWRAHHLALCGNTYIGKGYTPEYSARINAMMDGINRNPRGVPVRLVEGPDDWCQPLLQGDDEASRMHGQHCNSTSTARRDALALADLTPILGHEVKAGDTLLLTPGLVLKMRKAFYHATRFKQQGSSQEYGAPRRGCQGCPWSELCDTVARDHDPNVKLFRETIPFILHDEPMPFMSPNPNRQDTE